jgi:predicted secreted hydrolase
VPRHLRRQCYGRPHTAPRALCLGVLDVHRVHAHRVCLQWSHHCRLLCMALIGLCLSVFANRASLAAPPVDEPSLNAEGFALALTPREFEFPRDHGPHPDFRDEWWYVTGNLDGQHGERIGFELTLFRFALTPAANPGTTGSQVSSSQWRARQFYMAHFAITDVSREKFWFTERYARDALGLAGAQSSPFRAWLEDWVLEEQGDAWRLHAADRDYTLTLSLKALTPPIPNGDRGLIRKASTPGAASYYYSIPRMAAQGTLTRAGQSLEVNGLAWLDREWSSDALRLAQRGWDWFAIQLQDGSALMFYSRRDGLRDEYSAGTYIAPDGAARPLKHHEVQIESLDHWTSPRGGRYPSHWKLTVPPLALSLDIRPVLADQELNTSPRYWEGAVNVEARRAGQAMTGRGYVELVGYAR